MVVRHDDPAAPNPRCSELVRRGDVRVTQPARVVLGGLATLGRALPVVCLGCGAELRVVSWQLLGDQPPRAD